MGRMMMSSCVLNRHAMVTISPKHPSFSASRNALYHAGSIGIPTAIEPFSVSLASASIYSLVYVSV